jgi:ketosteroid isomerase-like protein
MEKLLTVSADDAEWTLMATGETFQGLESIRGLASQAFRSRRHTKELGMELRNTFASHDGKCMCWEFLHRGIATEGTAFQDAPPPGSTLSVPIVFVCDIENDKITSIREYFDVLTFREPGKQRRFLK